MRYTGFSVCTWEIRFWPFRIHWLALKILGLTAKLVGQYFLSTLFSHLWHSLYMHFYSVAQQYTYITLHLKHMLQSFHLQTNCEGEKIFFNINRYKQIQEVHRNTIICKSGTLQYWKPSHSRGTKTYQLTQTILTSWCNSKLLSRNIKFRCSNIIFLILDCSHIFLSNTSWHKSKKSFKKWK